LALAQVDFVKIDVEGAEARVIAGAATVLKSMRPILLLEVNDKALRAQGNCADSLIGILRGDLGYEIFVFSPVTGLLEAPHDGDPLSANVVAIPSERVADTVTAR
jgi:methyltransferase FkbM-like protein